MRSKFRAVTKLAMFLFALSCYFIIASLLYPIRLLSYKVFLRLINKTVSFYSKAALAFMGIRVNIQGVVPKRGNYLVVSNHLSYLDILVISSFFPSSFVTSVEIKETPILGQICFLAGCIFVERRNKQNILSEKEGVAKTLAQIGSVTLFPEATSTNGEKILNFKRPFFKSAIDAKVAVLPMTLNYSSIDGGPVHKGNRDMVFWYGDMSFFPHLFKFLSLKNIVVSVSVSSVINDIYDHNDLTAFTQNCIELNFLPV